MGASMHSLRQRIVFVCLSFAVAMPSSTAGQVRAIAPPPRLTLTQAPTSASREPVEAFLQRESAERLHRRGGIAAYTQDHQMSAAEALEVVEYARSRGIELTSEQVQLASPFMRRGDTIEEKLRVTTNVFPILVALGVVVARGCAQSMLLDEAFHYGAQFLGFPVEKRTWKQRVLSCVVGGITGGLVSGARGKLLATRVGPDANQAFINGIKESFKVDRVDMAVGVIESVTRETVANAFDGNAATPCDPFVQDFGITGSTVVDLEAWSRDCPGTRLAQANAEAFSAYDSAMAAQTVTPSAVIPVTLYATDGTYPRTVIPAAGGQAHVTYGFIPTQIGTVTAELVVRNENIEYVVHTASIVISSSWLNLELEETVPIAAETLLALNPGNDYAFHTSLRLRHSNGFSIQFDTIGGNGVPIFVDTSANLPVVLRASAIQSGNVVDFKGNYEDPEAQTPSSLSLHITGSSTQTVNLLPGLTGTGTRRNWTTRQFIPNGLYEYVVEAVQGGITYRSAPAPVRVSSSLPLVSLELDRSTATIGETIGGTITVTDAVGPVPNIDVGLSCNGKGPFRNTAGLMVRKVRTDSQGRATFGYEVITSGTQTILAMEPLTHQYDLADFSVAGSNSNVYTVFTWNRDAGRSNDDVAVYELNAYVEYPRGRLLDPGDYVYFYANHGTFRDARDQTGTSSNVQNEYTLTKAQADSGSEMITIRLPKYGVETTHVVDLPVGQGTRLERSRSLGLQATADSWSYGVDVSPDGRYVAFINGTTVNITGFYPSSGGASFTLPDDGYSLSFSPDSTQIAAGDQDGTVTIYNINTGSKFSRTVTDGRRAIPNLHWYATDRIAIATEGAVATSTVAAYRSRVLQLNAGLNILSTTHLTNVTDSRDILKIQCHATSAVCAAAADNGRWSLIRTSGGEIQSFVHPDNDDFSALAFSADGSRLLVGSYDDNVTDMAYLKLYSVSTAGATALSPPLTGNIAVLGAAFFHDGVAERLALAGTQYTEIYYDFGSFPALVGDPLGGGESMHFRMTADRELVLLGNATQWTYNFSSDRTGPSIYVDADGPVPYRETSFELKGRMTDSSAIVSSEYFRETWHPLAIGTGGSFAIPMTGLVVGGNRIEIRGSDRFGNSTSTPVEVIRSDDSTPPRATGCSALPPDGIVGDAIRVTCTVVDDDSSVASVTATVRDSAGNSRATGELTLSNSAFTHSFATSGWLPDLYTVDVTAVDASEHANGGTIPAATGFRLKPVLGNPSNLIATSTDANTIAVTWTAAAGASAYQIFRRAPGGSFNYHVTTATPPWNDFAVSSSTSYLYKVAAVASDGRVSSFSNTDIATTVSFADYPLAAGITRVRAVHLTELRQAIDVVRLAGGLSSATYSRQIALGLVVRADDISEMRQALAAAFIGLGLPAPVWPQGLAPGVVIRAADIQRLRDAIR